MWPYAPYSILGRCDMKPVHCALNIDDDDDSSIGSWDQIQMSNSTYNVFTHVLRSSSYMHWWYDCDFVHTWIYRSIEMFRLSWRELKIEEVIAKKNAIYRLKLSILLFNDWTTYSSVHCTSHALCSLLFKSKVIIT